MKNQIFKIGEEVVALTNPKEKQNQKRVKGNKYIVNSILYCSGCGVQMINITKEVHFNYTGIIECSCNTNTITKNKLLYTVSKHFAKIQELPQLLEEAIQSEDYEFATLLRDI